MADLKTLSLSHSLTLTLTDLNAGSASIIIECPSRAKRERRAPGGAWRTGLAEIAHEAPDFCNVDVDLIKGYAMGSVTFEHLQLNGLG